MLDLVCLKQECRLEETFGETNVSRSHKLDVDLVPGVQTLHQQTDAILITAGSFRIAHPSFSLTCNVFYLHSRNRAV